MGRQFSAAHIDREHHERFQITDRFRQPVIGLHCTGKQGYRAQVRRRQQWIDGLVAIL